MPALQDGFKGAEVKKLQEALKQRGFNPGAVDGDFGAATTATVIAFQKSEGLLGDGIAGPRTQRAFGSVSDDSLPNVIPGVTVTVVSKMFPATPLDNIQENLPFVCSGLKGKDTHRSRELPKIWPGTRQGPYQQPCTCQRPNNCRPASGYFSERQGTANQGGAGRT
jgi:peptidoglycan hydrolase-like protein with peptidoglycan-binding domain